MPEDIYPVVITDVELIEKKAYQSDDDIEQLKFTFSFLDEEFKERKIWKDISPVMSVAKPGMNPSNFNVIYEAVYGRTPYQDQLTVITPDTVNDFIGKELRLVIKQYTKQNGNIGNKVDGFMKLKVNRTEELAKALEIKPENIPQDDTDELNAELSARSKQAIENNTL